MLGIAVYMCVFAYGRMTKAFGRRVWLVLIALALATTLLSAWMTKIALDLTLALPAIFALGIFVVLFALGMWLGRWLDRNKDTD